MAVLVTYSEQELQFDTIPAIKITNFYPSTNEGIYSYVKLYCHKGALKVSYKSFERLPNEHTRMAFCFCPLEFSDKNKILLEFNSQELRSFSLINQGEMFIQEKIDVKASSFSGSDNQGFYFGINFEISKELQQRYFGSSINLQGLFLADCYQYNLEKDGFSATMPVEYKGERVFSTNMQSFLVVAY